LIVRADESPSLIHSGSTVSGIEMTIKNFAPYIYHGGTFIGRDIALDANGRLRLQAFAQQAKPQHSGSYVRLVPHHLAPPQIRRAFGICATRVLPLQSLVWAPGPKSAREDAVWFDLRSVLPSTAPAVEYR
jgi:hypothetical protein